VIRIFNQAGLVAAEGNIRTINVYIVPNSVQAIEASDEELELINSKISGIPKMDGICDSVTWYGDDAKFIVANLDGLRQIYNQAMDALFGE